MSEGTTPKWALGELLGYSALALPPVFFAIVGSRLGSTREMMKKTLSIFLLVTCLVGMGSGEVYLKHRAAIVNANQATLAKEAATRRYNAFLSELSDFSDQVGAHVETVKDGQVTGIYTGGISIEHDHGSPCTLHISSADRIIDGPPGTEQNPQLHDMVFEASYDGVPLTDPTLTLSVEKVPAKADGLDTPEKMAGFWRLKLSRRDGFSGGWRGGLYGESEHRPWSHVSDKFATLYYDDSQVAGARAAVQSFSEIKRACATPPPAPEGT